MNAHSASWTYALRHGRCILVVVAAINTHNREVGRRLHVRAVLLEEGLQPVIVGIVTKPTSDGEFVRGIGRGRSGNVVERLYACGRRAVGALSGCGCCAREDRLVNCALAQAGSLDGFREAATKNAFS